MNNDVYSGLNPDNITVVDFGGPATKEAILRSDNFRLRENVGLITQDLIELGYDGLWIGNQGGWMEAYLQSTFGSGGRLTLSVSGQNLVRIGNNGGATGEIRTYNNSNQIAWLVRNISDAGYFELRGPNGNNNFVISSTGTANKGSFSIHDELGFSRAGMNINGSGQGVVWGDVKSFRIEHPTQQGKEIWYACVEGPEIAAYQRGTATLKNGEAFIPFAEHFKEIANPTTMTVTLTPLSSQTYGLAVVEKRADGFFVEELMNGTGNFSFDWEVKCVRKGYENFEVVREAKELLFPPAGEDQVITDK